ncbi:hypothetical protein GCM10010517_30420 [Streptosporangium fragile]|uniref:Uncharacterized protein n=1 Tax=Streptosporangium fragile TaxID=46186 RepID=A0ABP6IFH0_9ACTN
MVTSHDHRPAGLGRPTGPDFAPGPPPPAPPEAAVLAAGGAVPARRAGAARVLVAAAPVAERIIRD